MRVRRSHANYEFGTIFGGRALSLSPSSSPILSCPRVFFAREGRSGEYAITLVYPLFRKGKLSGVNAPRPSSDGALNNTLSLLLLLLSLILRPPFFPPFSRHVDSDNVDDHDDGDDIDDDNQLR